MPAPFQYRLHLRLLSLLFPFLLLRELSRRGGGWRFFRQRLGFGYRKHKDRPLWLHAASVGELNTALPLLHRLQSELPDTSFIVTTNTATAAGLLERQKLANCTHYYLPVDLPGAVGRFLKRIQPRAGLIMETELWANLYAACSKKKIPLVLINGRLSAKSLHAPRWVRNAQQYCLTQVRHILARSAEDRKRFLHLQAPPAKVEAAGNLKYATPSGAAPALQTATRRSYVLAVSTHQDEELRFARLYQVLRRYNHLLVIAPRHPERREAILKQLMTLPLAVDVRSRGDTVMDSTDVYLLDTMGELNSWLSGAALVLIGGSWIPHGGQNILEPARAGKTAIAGPYMHNFAQETAELVADDAAVHLYREQDLLPAVERFLQHPELATEMGNKAAEFMRQKADVLEHYIQSLKKLAIL
jgi:3-deoxy-D-manno-octulosonic-acid transferase